MKGHTIIIGLFSIIVYLLLVAVFFLAMPFMVSWGGKQEWYIILIGFLQDIPFELTGERGEVNLNLIFINAFFWMSCIAIVLWLLTTKSIALAYQSLMRRVTKYL